MQRPDDEEFLLFTHTPETHDVDGFGYLLIVLCAFFALFGLILPVIPSGRHSAADEAN